jgi:hypothetical protein
MRGLLLSLALLAGCATAPHAAAPQTFRSADGFVLASDQCGASAYAHLVGEEYAKVEQASLPASAVVQRHRLTTLEYRPGQLNVVLDGGGRIAAIGCF